MTNNWRWLPGVWVLRCWAVPNFPMRLILPFIIVCLALPWAGRFLPAAVQLAWVDWFVPLILLGIGWPLLGRARANGTAEKFRFKNLLWIPVVILIWLVMNLALPVGYRIGWSYFTYGSVQMSPEFRHEFFIKLLPLGLASIISFELIFRKWLWDVLAAGAHPWRAWFITSLVAGSVRLPYLSLAYGDETIYLTATAISLFAAQFALGSLRLASGAVWPSIALHLLMFFTGTILMADILDAHMTLLNYSSSSTPFYVSMAVSHVLAALLVPLVMLAGRIFKAPR